MLKAGKLDIGGLSPLQLERQVDGAFKKRFAIYEQPSQGYTYLGFNLRKKPFNNPRVRQALSLAVDRKEIIDLALFLSRTPLLRVRFMPGSTVYPHEVLPRTLLIPGKPRRCLRKRAMTESIL